MRMCVLYFDTTDGGGGGDPVAPAAPKGYVPISVDQRNQWNAFLDYAGKQPGANLDDPAAQAALLGQYKKANPAFSITAAQIPHIQYEAYQLRKGDKLGNLGSNELAYIRQGLAPAYLNADTSKVGKLYYPQVAGYGTDLENYYNAKFKPVAGATTSVPPNVNTPAAVATGAPAAKAATSVPPGAIPRPDYQNPGSRLQYAKAWTQKYGPLMQGRGDTPLRVNEVPEGTDDDQLTAKEMSEKAASKLGLDPALLYSSAMEEGMSGLWGSGKKLVDFSGDDKYPIDGFVNFGLDNFSDFFPQLVKKGYLPADFKAHFNKAVRTNEKNQAVNSANFKTAEAALQAKAAVLRNVQDETESYAKKHGVNLSPAAKEFFSLINYNAGEGTMQKMLAEYNAQGYLKDDKFLKARPSAGWKVPYENVIRRMQMRDALKKEKLFD